VTFDPYATPELRRLEGRSHLLKSWPENFRAVLSGRKRFEIRRDDRTPAFQPGDVVVLHEYEPASSDIEGKIAGLGYTGRKALFFIGYVERSPALPDGWCGFELVSSEDLNRVALALGRDK
jgi:hypothetical protein